MYSSKPVLLKLSMVTFIIPNSNVTAHIARTLHTNVLFIFYSPIREILIKDLPVPKMVERTHGPEEGGKYSRTHRRSWSTDEVSESNSLTTPALQRLK